MSEAYRCEWAGDDPLYRDYHDREWGVPMRDPHRLFELLCLEGAQAGLAWITILRKRDGYRAAFEDFDPARVAAYGDEDRERLLHDPRIVRNRAKIDAFIGNARAFLQLPDFTGLAWSFVGGTTLQNRWGRSSRSHLPPMNRSPCHASFGASASDSWARRSATPSCSRRAWSTTTWSTASATPTCREAAGDQVAGAAAFQPWPP